MDRFGGRSLAELNSLLSGSLKGVFGGVHLLPFFFPIDGSDAGFDPIDHTQVDPRLGTWADVSRLGADVEIMADLIVNHISADSPQFRDFSTEGSKSDHAGLFLTMDRVFPNGARAEDLLRIYRPRPGLPLTCATLSNGEKKILWTTFTPKQVDIDVESPQGQSYLSSILATFQNAGVKVIRLDAAGYAIKRPGTSCFMIPETYEFIGQLARRARDCGIEVLVEIHSYYQEQIEIAKRVDRVYDFALPPLILDALFSGRSSALRSWLYRSPRNAITVLDTHDGIGVMDVGADAATGRPGLLAPEAIDRLVETIHEKSLGGSRLATGAAASNLDLYQVNCTFYDALGRDDQAYLLARAIQFFAPGVPQVYYVGLLAGKNDADLLKSTGVGRDINRHYFSSDEVREALKRPVVIALLELIRFRNAHPAFEGDFTVDETPEAELQLTWSKGRDRATLRANLKTHEFSVLRSKDGVLETWNPASSVTNSRN